MNVNFVSLGCTSCGGKSHTWVLITAEIDFQSPPHLLLPETLMLPVSVTVTLGLTLAPVPSPMDSRRHTPFLNIPQLKIKKKRKKEKKGLSSWVLGHLVDSSPTNQGNNSSITIFNLHHFLVSIFLKHLWPWYSYLIGYTITQWKLHN